MDAGLGELHPVLPPVTGDTSGRGKGTSEGLHQLHSEVEASLALGPVLIKVGGWARQFTWQRTKLEGDLNVIPDTHMVWGEDRFPKAVSDVQRFTVMCMVSSPSPAPAM